MYLLQLPLLITNPILGGTILSIFFVLYGPYGKRLTNLMFCFVFINGALNTNLKYLLKIPLHSSLNNPCWWGFPSGHMGYGLVFWGILWINSNFNKKLFGLLVMMLLCSGAAMKYKNYHNVTEMIGAVPPSALILYLYYLALKRIDLTKNNLLYLNCLSISFQIATLAIVKSPCTGYSFGWIGLNLGANLGFTITSLLVGKKGVKNNH